jgi:YD repeat-containing protein
LGRCIASSETTDRTDAWVRQAGNITRTDITDPRGHVERLAFNGDHLVTSDTQAFGTSLARTTTFERQASTNLLTAAIDPLSRRTEYTYDASGHVLTTTHMAGTSEAATTTYAYEQIFHQLTSVTDPLQHTWTLGYDAQNRLTSTSDPLSHASTIVLNAAGQVTSVTDPLTHQWQTGYSSGDRVTMTSPLGAVWRQFVDAGGRVRSTTDPLGRVTKTDVDALNRPTTITDGIITSLRESGEARRRSTGHRLPTPSTAAGVGSTLRFTSHQRRSKTSTSSERYKHVFAKVMEVIDRHDPLGLRRMGAPSDEYEPQAAAIARRMLAEDFDKDYSVLVWSVFHDAFGDAAGQQRIMS